MTIELTISTMEFAHNSSDKQVSQSPEDKSGGAVLGSGGGGGDGDEERLESCLNASGEEGEEEKSNKSVTFYSIQFALISLS